MNRPPTDRPFQAFEIVFWHVLDLMSEGRLLPGDTLFETALSQELGLSRTPVREALARLVAEGLLENPAGTRGYRVPELSLEDMQQVFQAREILESSAAALAAERARKVEVEELEAIHKREVLFSEQQDRKGYCQANVDFHFAVVRIGGNRYIERAFRPVFWRSTLYVNYLAEFHPASDEELKAESGHNSPAEHAALIRAIARRAPKAAAKAAADHLRSTRAFRILLDTERARHIFGRSKR
ncbi:MAG: GntR family transcriptional regulator [Synergistaceae bacterium]|nr:GntR family transcriptional regulator [Synergistaceae bacterium]